MSVPSSTEEKIQNLLLNICDTADTFDSIVDSGMSNNDELYFFPEPIPTKPGNIALLGKDGRIVDSTKQFTLDDLDAASKDHTHPLASSSVNGLMSCGDKAKLDGIEAGANKTIVDDVLNVDSENPVQNKLIASGLASVMVEVSKKTNKVIPKENGALAALNSKGELSDSGVTISFGTWTPDVSGAASYTYRSGSYLRFGNSAIVSFYVYGTFEGDTSTGISITGCPLTPLSNGWCGGGNLSGYTASSDVVFTGWAINTYGVLTPCGQTTSSAGGNKYSSQAIYQKESGVFSASGTIAFQVNYQQKDTSDSSPDGNQISY